MVTPIAAISTAISIILMLALMLPRNLPVGLLMLVIQIIVKLGVFFRRKTLIMRILMCLIELVMDVAMLLIDLIVLGGMAAGRVGHCGGGKAS